ncbi:MULTISPECIES: hypothetical protein [Methylobacterium]|jgi:1,6-anhydro-N-acetylmuramate kinase|uniref:Uncharacterized protein n=2 Tax=Methylobacterium TaxID=407 RepID=A0A2R4WRR2_9HYPH|nr:MULTISPECIES: hypothetical protein [Methylobacterium]AWB24230.1 hypothetical protein DA075_27895 [Methylobacterium currus]NGM35096.1 hypothetical protein [Methylobacterium sp. DB0501]
MSYHRNAHDVAGAFDGAMQGLAMGLGAALVRDRAIRRERDAMLAEDYRAIAAQARAARLTVARARQDAARQAEADAHREARDLAAAAQVALLRRRIAERASAA